MKTFTQFMKESEDKIKQDDDSDYHVGHAIFGTHSKSEDDSDDDTSKDDDDKKSKDDDSKDDDDKDSKKSDDDKKDDDCSCKEVKEEILGTSTQSDSEVEDKHKDLVKHYSGFTPDHKKAIKEYTRTSINLNKTLLSEHKGFDHKGNPHDEEDHKRYMPQIKKLDSAMKKHKTPEDMHVYTGLGYSPAQYKSKDHNGTDPIKVHHPAFTSTSISRKEANTFAESSPHHENDSMKDHVHMMKIHVPKGSHGAYVDHHSSNDGEKEFMLPRNSKLHVHPVPEYSQNGHSKMAIWHAKLVK